VQDGIQLELTKLKAMFECTATTERFIVSADEKPTAFLELESAIQAGGELPRQAGEIFPNSPDMKRASDGDIGHVKDFYFNDQQWAIRYVVADTGSWLLGRLVLISPLAFGNLRQDADCLLVNLTRQQIENSPAIESHKPVSLQYQAYWDGCETWGAGGFPEAPPPPHLMPSEAGSDDLARILRDETVTL
jgi:hypothetical protein